MRVGGEFSALAIPTEEAKAGAEGNKADYDDDEGALDFDLLLLALL